MGNLDPNLSMRSVKEAYLQFLFPSFEHLSTKAKILGVVKSIVIGVFSGGITHLVGGAMLLYDHVFFVKKDGGKVSKVAEKMHFMNIKSNGKAGEENVLQVKEQKDIRKEIPQSQPVIALQISPPKKEEETRVVSYSESSLSILAATHDAQKVVTSVVPIMSSIGVSKLSVIQATLPKENGYPTVGFLESIDALGKQSLKPTLLLIDEVGIDTFSYDKQVTEKQLELIGKVKSMGGRILVCCRPGQPNLKPALQAAVENSKCTYYLIEELNKLQNKGLYEELQKSDFVIVAGFDVNECVRATIGAKRDDRNLGMSDILYLNGMVQAKIPVLYSDDCSRGMQNNVWEGSRFDDSLFFWGKSNSVYHLVEQAVVEYRQIGGDMPADFESTLNLEKLNQIKECVFAINGLTTDAIKDLFRSFKIAPSNPLLEQITRATSS